MSDEVRPSTFVMPPLSTARRTKRLWSVAEIRTLRELASRGDTLAAIANALRRSPAAVRGKAATHGISIGTVGRRSASRG
jgi:hypothetical protein